MLIVCFQFSNIEHFSFIFLSQDLHGEILAAISGSLMSRPLLVFEKKKPIPLKLFTPKIVEV